MADLIGEKSDRSLNSIVSSRLAAPSRTNTLAETSIRGCLLIEDNNNIGLWGIRLRAYFLVDPFPRRVGAWKLFIEVSSTLFSSKCFRNINRCWWRSSLTAGLAIIEVKYLKSDYTNSNKLSKFKKDICLFIFYNIFSQYLFYVSEISIFLRKL